MLEKIKQKIQVRLELASKDKLFQSLRIPSVGKLRRLGMIWKPKLAYWLTAMSRLWHLDLQNFQIESNVAESLFLSTSIYRFQHKKTNPYTDLLVTITHLSHGWVSCTAKPFSNQRNFSDISSVLRDCCNINFLLIFLRAMIENVDFSSKECYWQVKKTTSNT